MARPFSVRGAAWLAGMLAAVLVTAYTQAALAQSWTERPYAPAVGSRWTIESRMDSKDERGSAESRIQHIRNRAELTIEQKLADGFRVTYVVRESHVSGNQPSAGAMDTIFGALKGVVIHARTDAAGKPLVVENLAETHAVVHGIIDKLAAAMADPKGTVAIKSVMEKLLIREGAAAAQLYLGELTELATAQNTGLKPGEVRRETEQLPSPLGGVPIKATLVTQLASWDDAAGKERIVRRREIDPEAVKAFTLLLLKKLGIDKPEMTDAMKQITFNVDSTTTIDVEGGMARRLDQRSTTTVSAMGQTFRKKAVRVVTISALP